MRLISVKILGDDFRSLASNKLYEFNVSYRKDRLSTKIFAGLNGSGKSNFLELLAEIFYYLEQFHLTTINANDKRGKNFGFEIEYYLPKAETELYTLFSDELAKLKADYVYNNLKLTKLKREIFENIYLEEIETEISNHWKTICEQFLTTDSIHVRVIKEIDIEAKFYLKRNNDATYVSVTSLTQELLPKKIIAYTSGQNELLSNPFYKMKYRYFKEIEKNSLEDNDRLFFLDYSSNFSIFVSNLLLANPKKLKYLKDIFKVHDLHSFRITINFVDYKKYKIALSDELINSIQKLKQCATSWIQRQQNKEEFLILDYRVNEATREAFQFHFESAFQLFKTFYELEILNMNLVQKDTRSLILKAHKSLNLSDEMPKPDPSRLIFRIERIYLNKIIEEGKAPKQIYYKGLSDGEHQFNEVIGSVMMMENDGCLFLMDEPDTHFNPVWRAKMIEMLNHVAAYSYDSTDKPEFVRRQEIIITTHSPFVISDSQTEDVYKFDKLNGEVTYINPKVETYGASVSLLLQEIFDRKISISDLSNFDLEELRKAFKELKSPEAIREKIEETKAKLVDFGESIEKFDLYSLIRKIEKDLDTKK